MDNDKKYLSLREIQLCELEILKKVVRFLEKNELEYFLDGGTLLGAVRHKGFIPWDDDIDIIMPRESYNKLIEMRKGKPAEGNIVFVFPGESDAFCPFIKVYDTSVRAVDPMIFFEKPMYVWIDIFPLDHCSDDKRRFNVMFNIQNVLRRILWAGISKINLIFPKHRFLKLAANSILKIIYCILGKNTKVTRLFDVIADRMNKKNINSNHFTDGTWPTNKNVYYEKDWIYPLGKCMFEGEEFRAPANCDKFLTRLYGDYMTLPPESDRLAHGITAWRIDK